MGYSAAAHPVIERTTLPLFMRNYISIASHSALVSSIYRIIYAKNMHPLPDSRLQTTVWYYTDKHYLSL